MMDTPELFEVVRKLLLPHAFASVLDIGSSNRPQKIIAARRHVCADPYAPALADLVQETWNLDAIAALAKAGVGEFEAIVMLDVIEHMEKDDGRAAICDARLKAPRCIVIFTPLGFVEQGPKEPGGEWQRHRSGWTPEDFGDGWFTVRGVHANGLEPPIRTEPVPCFFAIWLAP